MSSEVETALRAQLIEQRFAALEMASNANADKIAQLTTDREKALTWGIVTLGAGVLGLVIWIFNLITGHVR